MAGFHSISDKINDPIALGKKIVELRKKAGLTQSQFARLGCFDVPTLNLIENGKKILNDNYLIKISNALGFPRPEDLYDPRGLQIGYVITEYIPKDLVFIKELSVSYDKDFVSLVGYSSEEKLFKDLNLRNLHLVYIGRVQFLLRQYELLRVAQIFSFSEYCFASKQEFKKFLKEDNEKFKDFFSMLNRGIQLKNEEMEKVSFNLMFYPDFAL